MDSIDHIQKLLTDHGIDYSLSMEILNNYRAGIIGTEKPVEVSGLPGAGSVCDMSSPSHEIDPGDAMSFLSRYGIPIPGYTPGQKTSLALSRRELEHIGILLTPFVACGVLNGGSATSYVDIKKNMGFHSEYLRANKALFDTFGANAAGKPKGITPAFVNPDGSPGPDYMELKMRGLLIQIARYKKISGKSCSCPLFQMTSVGNDSEIRNRYREYADSPLLRDLMEYTGVDITIPQSAAQPMISAYTTDEGKDRDIFYGKNGKSPLALPGGHGQNFRILKPVYEALGRSGKTMACIGNVDNLGNLPDPCSVALFALKAPDAAFEFSYKTPVDVKGGILIKDASGHLNCGDIGVAVSPDEITHAEASGAAVLFNCATGLFNLDFLNSSIDRIAREIPVRFSVQDKDAGRYTQAEQVTWEIIGLLDRIIIFGVDKYTRFIAAKLLLESFLASGIGLDSPELHKDPVLEVGRKLHTGLFSLLKTIYGLQLRSGRWTAVPLRELL